MSEMVERVARAICSASELGQLLPHCVDAAWQEWLPEARAAIEAMLQPTEQQIAAAWDVITAEKQGQGITRLMPGLGAREIYQAMITAALGEGE